MWFRHSGGGFMKGRVIHMRGVHCEGFEVRWRVGWVVDAVLWVG